ncbi:MAG: thiamine phosphate synthase [Propionicimonas sp.]|nr:thiamine phosphate synthase [Propionicimonas sp.]
MTVLLGVATRMRLARLLLITDLRPDARDLPDFVAAVLGGGVDVVQLRDPRAEAAALAAGFAAVRGRVAERKALLGLYDSLDLAREVQADLLQLSERGPSAVQARGSVHQWAQIGRSCHSRRQLDAALADPDIDYLTVGPVVGGLFGTGGLDLVEYAATRAPARDRAAKPWFAVGGITLDNLDEVLAAGARRVAVSRAIADADQPAAAAASFAARLAQSWKDDPGMDQVVLGSLGPSGG